MSSDKALEEARAIARLSEVLAEVEKTNRTNTRNPGTDWRCRDWFTDHGQVIATALAAKDAEIERLTAALAESDRHAEKIEALLDPHIAWEGQPPIGCLNTARAEIERLTERVHYAEGTAQANIDRANEAEARAEKAERALAEGVKVKAEIAPELPDDIRDPLHSLQADVDWLVARIRKEDDEVVDMCKDSIRNRLSHIEEAAYRLNARTTATSPSSWPAGCRAPNSCSRHRSCMYIGCAHSGEDIGSHILAALAPAAPEGGQDAPTAEKIAATLLGSVNAPEQEIYRVAREIASTVVKCPQCDFGIGGHEPGCTTPTVPATTPAPVGWKLVPIEPDDGMIEAGQEAIAEKQCWGGKVYASDVWAAMLAVIDEGEIAGGS